MKFTEPQELFSFLKINSNKQVYLIHEVDREAEARSFAAELQATGLTVKVAADYRKGGENAVLKAIEASDFSVAVAYDDETVRKLERYGIPVIHLKETTIK